MTPGPRAVWLCVVLGFLSLLLGSPSRAIAQTTCLATDTAITDPNITGTKDDLITDCTTLLSLKDTLRGAATLNWARTLGMSSWEGITVAGTPPRVTQLKLSSKSLTGTIPAALGDLTSLTSLDLFNNQLTGPIPKELGALTNLTELHINKNQLSGPIPAALGNLANLTLLDLTNSQLTGPIPATLGNLASLTELNLQDNQLSGPIPAALGALTNLTNLDLFNNQLSGPIPATLGNLASLTSLFLNDNQLSGPIPVQLGALTNLTNLWLHNNQLTGPIWATLGNLTSLTSLLLFNNQLSGAIPAKLGNLTNLTNLSLYDNQLSGPIPAALGDLTSLRSLYLHRNQLSGALPPALGNLTNLEYLWLQRNQLSGPLPVEWAGLAALQDLDLSDNAALSGPIPTWLGSLTNLQYLYLRFTALSGPIPPSLGNLASLFHLHLAATDWTGTIPQTLLDKQSAGTLRLWTNRRPTPPVVEAQAVVEDQAYTFVVPAFSDRDGDPLHVRARQADGQALPAWLEFDETTRTLSGSPPGDVEVRVEVIATDEDTLAPGALPCDPEREEAATEMNPPRLCASVSFLLYTNQPPVITAWPDPAIFRRDELDQFYVVTFADEDVKTVKKAVERADGGALPAWLGWGNWAYENVLIRPNRAALAATTMAEALCVRVTLTDRLGLSTSDTLAVYLVEPGDSPAGENPCGDAPTERPSGPGDPGNGGGGGGGGGTSDDQHGNTPQDATRVPLDAAAPWTSVTDGQINTADDVDYFTFEIPHAGVFVVETTGRTDTRGTVWQDGTELGTADSGGERRNFRLTVPVEAGPVVVAVEGRTGAYTLETRLLVGYLENPGPNSFQSGIGVLSGWVCAADEVLVELNGVPQPAAYGTERVDTEEICGDPDNGFGLLFNWNLLGDGAHEVVALVDGVELDRATVRVTTLGAEFLRGVEGECVVEDFPRLEETVTLVWQQTKQNFVLTDGAAPRGANRAGTAGVGFLENPGPNSFQSGIGVISGWVCEAETVEIELTRADGEVLTQDAAYGTERVDTEEICGDPDNGFGLLFNWNQLGEGEHEVVAFVDGEALGRATVRVTTLGEEFVRDVAGECTVEDFPGRGETVTLEWQQNQQNFVITDVQ